MLEHRTLLKRGAYLLLAVQFVSSTSQASVLYTFNGLVPPNVVPTNPAIHPGESWTANFVINQVSGVASSEFTDYPGAVSSGSLAFSGGYVSPYDFSGFNVIVHDSGRRSSVYVYGTIDGSGIGFQAFSDLNPLSSKELPLAGTSILPSPTPTTDLAYVQLLYSDENGEVLYTSANSNNVSFVASVPEPASWLVASLLGGTFVVTGRRRYARQRSDTDPSYRFNFRGEKRFITSFFTRRASPVSRWVATLLFMRL